MGQRIKQIRKYFNLKQVDFGEKIGVKGNTIAAYETGAREPSESVIMAICREFNVSREWLETGEGEMFDVVKAAELDRIAAQYSKDPTFRAILDVYAKLPDDSRRIFEKMVCDLSDEIRRQRDPAAVTVEELEQNADQTESGLTGTDVQIS